MLQTRVANGMRKCATCQEPCFDCRDRSPSTPSIRSPRPQNPRRSPRPLLRPFPHARPPSPQSPVAQCMRVVTHHIAAPAAETPSRTCAHCGQVCTAVLSGEHAPNPLRWFVNVSNAHSAHSRDVKPVTDLTCRIVRRLRLVLVGRPARRVVRRSVRGLGTYTRSDTEASAQAQTEDTEAQPADGQEHDREQGVRAVPGLQRERRHQSELLPPHVYQLLLRS